MAELGLGDWAGGASRPRPTRRWERLIRRARDRLVLLGATPRADGPVVLAAAAVAAASLVFLAFPALDIGVSALFHQVGAGFPLAQDPGLRALRASSNLVQTALILGLLGRLVWVLARHQPVASARRCGYLLAALALGPGLVVNGLFKANWGRPRPIAVDLYGGDAPYQPVWVISDWCQSNCSFVSGEASAASWMVAAVLVLVPGRYRAPALAVAMLYALALSVNRLAFGGHFLSDVVLSWSISAVIFTALYKVMVSAPGVARRARQRGPRAVVPASA